MRSQAPLIGEIVRHNQAEDTCNIAGILHTVQLSQVAEVGRIGR